jgi:hypothetical protein
MGVNAIMVFFKVIENEITYCPECGWNVEWEFFPGNNGLIEKHWCSHCGYFGDA